ncbi:gluconate 2-dehydrogenase subunit 3 family protein [Rheinheimera sp.]|uniref:gluconate 2-dehydrogenase subunit 3 family protein n=1 Tax=Rheinheimera sp. TaxID=1869214 RepID=UPI003D2A0B59
MTNDIKQPDLSADNETPYQYQSGLSRRKSLKLLAALAASTMLPTLSGCDSPPPAATADTAGKAASTTEHWPELNLKPITAKGYGTDPNMILPPESPWPLTMSAPQLTLLALLSDILIPREGDVPSASEVDAPAIIDEWISAPYPRQQQDRPVILAALAWIDDEATLRFGSNFASLKRPQRLAIIDDIAFDNAQTKPQFQRIAKAFALLRGLVVAAFFSTPQGTKDIGYLGNTAIGGDYPGPTPEAKAHLDKTLANLGLKEFAWQPV